jgi:CHAT domain-containing protein
MQLAIGSRGKPVFNIQARLLALGYTRDAADGIYGPATMKAVSLFQGENRLPITGVVDQPLYDLILSDQAPPHAAPEALEAIDGPEAKAHVEIIGRAFQAGTSDERTAALMDGFMRFGPRLLTSLFYLEKNGDAVIHGLVEEASELFLRWLTGVKFTQRADEDERRALAATMILGMGGIMVKMQRIAALSILALPKGHPMRDEAKALEGLNSYIARCKADQDVEGHLLALGNILAKDLEPMERKQILIEEGLGLLDAVASEEDKRDFLVNGLGVYVLAAIEARDRGEDEARSSWAQKADALLERVTALGHEERTKVKNRLLIALLHEIQGRDAPAADVYKSIVEELGMENHLARMAAEYEGRLRVGLGAYERAVWLLSQIVDELEDRYLMALEENAIRLAAEKFSKAINNLSFAYAKSGRWQEAIRTVERGKSLRLRYRTALRTSSEGQALMQMEADLYALERGIPLEQKPGADKTADWVGQELSGRAMLMEAYRRARLSLDKDILSPPDTASIAGTLAPDEAVAVLGVSSWGTLLCIVLAGDQDVPSGTFLFEQWPFKRYARVFGGEKFDGWIFALGAHEAAIDPLPALDALLQQVDEAIGKPLARFFRRHKIKKATVIPHLWLQLAPFWALPALQSFAVKTAPSMVHFITSRKGAAAIRPQALLVSDPTLDLPVASVEVDLIERYGRMLKTSRLDRQQATEQNLIARLPGTGLVHFSGHGRCDLTHPTQSALLMHPAGTAAAAADGDPLAAIARQISEWKQAPDFEVYADIPGKGRLVERRTEADEVVERRLEYGAQGTLWAHYKDDRLGCLAELWSVGDMLVEPALADCGFVFLSACESGGAGLAIDIDEHAGIPSALQLAGISTVVCTLWPVSDAVTVLMVDLFYRQLFSGQKAADGADVTAVLRSTCKRLRNMTREKASEHLLAIKASAKNPLAKFRLEAYAAKIRHSPQARPFQHPYYWASFFVFGNDHIRFSQKEDDHNG